MQRRNFRKLRAGPIAAKHHHSVYVVLLDNAVGKFISVQKLNPLRDPAKPAVYVGMSGLPPEERFANHKKGLKAAGWVKLYGIRLLPELFQHFNPMPFDAAVVMERELAEDLRKQGYTVVGGH